MRKIQREIIHLLTRKQHQLDCSLMWSFTEKGFYISTIGYIMQDHMDLEREILDLKCRYDFDGHTPSDFCRLNGRTTTFFTWPKTRKVKL